MTTYVECNLNGKYPLIVPDFRAAFWNDRPNWHRGWMDSLAEHLKPGMKVFEAGSEHGDITAVMRGWVHPGGDVIPIEPAAHYWPYIRGTWDENGFPAPPELSFVGLLDQDFTRRRPVYRRQWPPESKGDGVPDGGFVHIHGDRNTPRITIDALAEYVRPDAIVMDIEGAELLALHGAERTLIDIRPLVWVSWHENPARDWYQYGLEEMHSYMAQHGYIGEELPWFGEGETYWLYSPR